MIRVNIRVCYGITNINCIYLCTNLLVLVEICENVLYKALLFFLILFIENKVCITLDLM